MLFPSRSPKKFEFQPRYYDPEKDSDALENGEDDKRIKFRRLRRRGAVQKASMRRSLMMLIVLLFVLWYLFDLAGDAPIEVESIKLEEITPDNNLP